MSTHAFCGRLVQALLAAGVRELVVSPGSRSTPLLLAALDSTLEIHSVIDERSAAFFALGRARADGSPVAFLCTSGTAGAHALPALLEARYAEHRVVAITADRPPEMHQCGANQTIDQEMLFASACPPALNFGVPEADPEEVGIEMHEAVHQAVALADGPIHINLCFRKPLEPSAEELALALPTLTFAPLGPPELLAKEETIEAIAAQCERAERGVIVAGAASGYGRDIVELAKATGFVLLAESTSGARFTGESPPQRCDAFPHILHALTRNQALAKDLDPDLILQFGCEPASASLQAWLATRPSPILRFRSTRPMTTSPGNSELVLGDPRDLCRRIANATSAGAESSFLSAWRNADEEAWAEVSRHLDQGSQSQADDQSEFLSEARAMATILENLPEASQLTLGNSMPIRSADMVLPGHRKALRILHQRGASGIDGLIAGAIGSSGPAHSALLLGDVSCSHDIASLALAGLARGPLTIIVIDNQGGQIFSHLPIAKNALARDSQGLWRTPPTLDFEKACRAFGLAYRRVDSKASLEAAMRWSQEESACCFLHLLVSDSSMLDFVERMREACLPAEKLA